MPVWVINCEMCEFDVGEMSYEHLNSLGVDAVPEPVGVKFKVRVGKVYEEQFFPVFRKTYLVDKVINGYERSKQDDLSLRENNQLSPSTKDVLNVAQNLYSTDGGFSTDYVHASGKPFSGPNNMNNMSEVLQYYNGRKWKRVKPSATKPNTWVGNAVTFGKTFAQNLVEGIADKAKVTPIPGLGVSYSEVTNILKAKNVIGALGLIRKSIDTITKEYAQPSELLDGKIVDDMFRSYLRGIVQSDATESNKELRNAAALALSNNETWEKIRDFSAATDLTGPGEENVENRVQNERDYRNEMLKETERDMSLATGMKGPGEQNVLREISIQNVYEGVPSSAATSNKLSK